MNARATRIAASIAHYPTDDLRTRLANVTANATYLAQCDTEDAKRGIRRLRDERTAIEHLIAARCPKVRTYGCRAARTGEVYAYTEPPTRGRCRASEELLVGNVWKVAGGWRHDAACDTYPTQSDAALALVRIICD